MGIRRIHLENFKSFRILDLDLASFNVLIGANASGKSNLVQALRFLQDIRTQGLDNAISQQGGIEYLRNVVSSAGPVGEPDKRTLVYEVHLDTPSGRFVRRIGPRVGLRFGSSEYRFQLRFTDASPGYEVAEEYVRTFGDVVRTGFIGAESRQTEVLGPGSIQLLRSNGSVGDPQVQVPSTAQLGADDLSFPWIAHEQVQPTSLVLWPPLWFAPFGLPDEPLISVYDIDPKFSKESISVIGKAELDADGRNLPIVLKRIRESEEDWRKLSNLVRDLLPFVRDLDVRRLTDKSLLFQLKEEFAPETFIPAFLISDGTINTVALIIALYFDRSATTIVEEPERNIHPHLIRRVLAMMKEVAERKQIIVTTHNPEVVKHAGVEHLLLVSRDASGYSIITRPADQVHLKAFLENEVGIDELYVQDFLKV